MKPEHRGIIAVVLSAAFFFLWMKFFSPSQTRPEEVKASSTQEETQTSPSPKSDESKKSEFEQQKKAEALGLQDPQAKLPTKNCTLKNDSVEIELTSDGAVATSWRIISYRKEADHKSQSIDLAFSDANGEELPLSLSFEQANFFFPKRPKYELLSFDDRNALFLWRSAEVEIQKKEKSGSRTIMRASQEQAAIKLPTRLCVGL